MYLLGEREFHAGLPGQEGQACFFFSLGLTLLCLLPFVVLRLCRRNHIDNIHCDHKNGNETKHNDDDDDGDVDDADDDDVSDDNDDDDDTENSCYDITKPQAWSTGIRCRLCILVQMCKRVTSSQPTMHFSLGVVLNRLAINLSCWKSSCT